MKKILLFLLCLSYTSPLLAEANRYTLPDCPNLASLPLSNAQAFKTSVLNDGKTWNVAFNVALKPWQFLGIGNIHATNGNDAITQATQLVKHVDAVTPGIDEYRGRFEAWCNYHMAGGNIAAILDTTPFDLDQLSGSVS